MLTNNKKNIVTRFAPSPTGFLHVGGVRTALYAWAWARKNNGRFILRIEDTDKVREVKGSIEHIMKSLKWLGITWDEGPDIGGPHAPYLQSKRLDIYKKYANLLIERGFAYSDPYTKEEVDVFRKSSEEEKKPFLYRDYRPKTFEVWDGTKPLRFKIKDIEEYKWMDVVRGELSAGGKSADDFILIKSDGYPTYNFAHIIDDLEMGVTHIMRADEFIASMPIYLSLYEALEITPPEFVTLPPILGKEGTKKLGKRDGAKDILDYQKEGFLPEAMLNFLAYLGWNPGTEKEILTAKEFVEQFDISRIHKSGASFNEEKLLWTNKEHIRMQSKETQLISVKSYMSNYSDEVLLRLLPSIIDRISNYGELIELEPKEFRFFIVRPVVDIKKVIWKDSDEATTKKHLEQLKKVIGDSDFSSVDIIKQAIMPYAEENGKGAVLWPLRMSLSGQDKSVDPFTICFVIGKEESILRIDDVLSRF